MAGADNSTDVPLRDHLEVQLADLRWWIDERFRMHDQHAAEALSHIDGRLAKIDEFLAMLITRREYDAQHDVVVSDLRALETTMGTKTTVSEFAAIEMRTRQNELWRENQTGRLWAMGISLAILQLLLSTAIGLVVHFAKG